ncbi:MAG TPA: PAC2 family protein [Candidatus Limnocylindrales bacterium]|nr:PAC2 family protein [Candidatus Limnocylindrales bacterium]
MALYQIREPEAELIAPVVIAALDGWVDAGSAATGAASLLAGTGRIVAEFDGDQLFDFRARRPTLEIENGKPERLTWPTLQMRSRRLGERDILVLTGAEPDFRWRRFASEVVELAEKLHVSQWISIGAIPAAVPHTRPVPILGTSSQPGLLRGDVQPGPDGLLRVPAACISVLDMAVSRAGIPAVGYFAQIPHYVSGEYPGAAAELLRAIGRHLDVETPLGELADEARTLRKRLDTAAALDENTRNYVERLEGMVDESRLPAGDDLIADIERFLRDRGTEMGGGGRPN